MYGLGVEVQFGDGLVQKGHALAQRIHQHKAGFPAREHAQGDAREARAAAHVQRSLRPLQKPLRQRRERIQIVAVHGLAGFRANARQVHARVGREQLFLKAREGFQHGRAIGHAHGGKPLG